MARLYLTNWKRPAYQGPGRKFTIMANPRTWERGEGRVWPFVPALDWLALVRVALQSASEVQIEAAWVRYTERFEERLRTAQLAPGVLLWANAAGDGAVADGDTLCCACAAGALCHRRIVAPWLIRAGWTVILDGTELPPTWRDITTLKAEG